MREVFDARGRAIHKGDMVECCPGQEKSPIPGIRGDRFSAGNLILGEVVSVIENVISGYVFVLGVQTQGDWEQGETFWLRPEQVVIVENGDAVEKGDAVKEFDLDSFNQMLGIGG